jgi:phosphonatase-like hydrolase
MPDLIKLVIFDLVGTTITDGGEIPETFLNVLAAHAIHVTPEDLNDVRGASKRLAMRSFLERRFPGYPNQAAVLSEQFFVEFCTRLAEHYERDGVHPLPGAGETFAWLRRKGIKIAINTGFDRAITDLVLHRSGWDLAAFSAVICADDVPQGRPAPYLIFRAIEAAGETSVRQVACVGDTVLDLQAGWNAGVHWNIGVLTGAHTRQQLERAPHTHLLEGVAELPSLWESIKEFGLNGATKTPD